VKRRTHCWKDLHTHVEEAFGFGSDDWAASFNKPGATCMLEDGHAGPHEWTDDDRIGVTFADSHGDRKDTP
jgi:hypothetical protein